MLDASVLALQRFVDTHRPGSQVRAAGAGVIDRYANVLPRPLLQLWGESGLGLYGDGLVQLIDPAVYETTLAGWLMLDEPDSNRVPIALSGFGHLFYFRQLSDVDEDVCVLDPHSSSGGVLTWSLDTFFNGLLCEPSSMADVLEVDAFARAAERAGALEPGEIYGYRPALRLGGSKSPEHVARYDAVVHLDFLLQLATS